MPSFHLVDPTRTEFRCILEIRPVLSKSELLGTLKNSLSLNLSQHIECIQLFAHPTSVKSLGAFVTFHSPAHAYQAVEELRNHAVHNHMLGAQIVSAIQQPGYYLPSNLVLPNQPFSNFRVITGSKPNESGGHLTPSRSAESCALHSDVLFSYNFAVLNVHGIIDQAELERVIRLRITIRIPIVCVQVWRARSSQSLHAYITFLSRSHAQWAATEIHGRKETHTWAVRSIRSSELERCARPPTEQERVNARLLSDTQQKSPTASSAIASSTTRLAFSPTAVIIPFYATLLPSSSCAPHIPGGISHAKTQGCATLQNELYGPSNASRKFARIQNLPATPKRSRSCGVIAASETTNLQLFSDGLVVPQLRIDPGTPRTTNAHLAPPILRARSQPVVPLLYPREHQSTINPVISNSVSTTPASQISRVETTLFAHHPIVEQDPSVELSSNSTSLCPGLSDDRHSRFDPFGESWRMDSRGAVAAMDRLTLRAVEHAPPAERPILGSEHRSTSSSSVLGEKTNILSLEGRIKPRTWQFRPLSS